MSANVQRLKKVSRNQQELIIEYLKANENFKTRKFSSTFSSDNYDRLWEELTNKLNCDGTGPSKTVDKWKKMLADWKSNTKNKAGRINKSRGGTGGGEKTTETLTDLEERLLAVWGKELTDGIAKTLEFGIPQLKPTEKAVTIPKMPTITDEVDSKDGKDHNYSSHISNSTNEETYMGLEDFTIEEPGEELISIVEKKRRLEKEAEKSLAKRQALMSEGTTKPKKELVKATDLFEKMQLTQNNIMNNIDNSISRLVTATEPLEVQMKEMIMQQKELIALEKQINQTFMLQLVAIRNNNTIMQGLMEALVKKHVT